MPSAAQLDGEELHEILKRFFQIPSDGVHRFEGTSFAVLSFTCRLLQQNVGAIDEYLALAFEADQIAAHSGDRETYAAAGAEYAFASCLKGGLAAACSVSEDVRARCGGDVAWELRCPVSVRAF